MSAPVINGLDVEAVGRASRRAAVLSLIGFVVVFSAIGYAIFELNALERQRDSMQNQVRSLQIQAKQYGSDLAKAQMELANTRAALSIARASLAAARAAINAFHSGDLEQAVHLYDEALAADPDDAYLQNLRAYSLFRLGRVSDAIEGERRSVAADPKYAWGYFDLARFLCAASPPQLDEARRAASKAVELRADIRDIMLSDGEFQRVCRRQVP